jgi:DNA-binding NarL/FixJ family response regulator
MIRLLLVDDESLIRRGLRAILQLEPDLDIVGEADNGHLAVQLVQQFHPDVVLMDVRMPVMDGVAATREICQTFPDTKVLVLTTFAEDAYISEALKNGAMGYLLKGTPTEDLVQAIQAAHKGYLQVGPGLARSVFAQLSAPQAPPIALTALTPREREILNWIASGASNREIAQQLFIAEKTVKNHITNILSRLDLRDRTQAAVYAHQHQIWLDNADRSVQDFRS